MFAVTVFGSPHWLVPYGPNTDDNLALKAKIELDAPRGKTGRSSRRPQAYLLRHQQTWIAQMAPRDFYAARAAVIEAQDEALVVPFWLGARKTTQAAAITAGLTVAWTSDWATYAINPPSLVGYDFFAPLLRGRFTQPPRLVSKGSDYINAEFEFSEQGSAAGALTPPADVDNTLATPDGYDAPCFLWTPEASTDPKLSFGQVDIDSQPLGPGREPSETYYPQARETVTQPTFKFASSADIIELLGWWFRRAGGADSCWVATTQKIGDLTADLPIGALTIPTVAPMSISVGDTLALLTTGLDPEFVRVQSIVAGVPHLGGPTAVAHPKAWTSIVPALLAHHTDEQIQFELSRAGDDWIGKTTLAFRELASEYAATDGEVRGTTIGRLPARAWLFRVDLDYVGAIQSWFFTSWESGGVTPDAQVWEYRDGDFDTLIQSIDLEDDELTFKVRWWNGCPWENWLPGKLAATGTLTIFSSDVATDGSLGAPVQKWAGALSTPQREGPILSVKVLGANNVFSRRAPHAQCTPPCWKRLYGGKCTLSIADWKFNATVSVIAGQTITIDTITRANGSGLPVDFGTADWFALGFVQWLNVSGQPMRAEVLAATAIAGGQITLTVGRQLDWNVGDGVVAVPGCDRQIATCNGRFGNGINFGGFFDMPAVDPSLKIPNSSQTPAKK